VSDLEFECTTIDAWFGGFGYAIVIGCLLFEKGLDLDRLL
jgi:hypothetical protein